MGLERFPPEWLVIAGDEPPPTPPWETRESQKVEDFPPFPMGVTGGFRSRHQRRTKPSLFDFDDPVQDFGKPRRQTLSGEDGCGGRGGWITMGHLLD